MASDGSEMLNDQYSENVLLQSEVEQLRIRVKAMQDTNETIQVRKTFCMFRVDKMSFFPSANHLNYLLVLFFKKTTDKSV